MFDWLFEIIAATLSFFYSITGNYAISIALLTIAVMIITTPFTLKGTRSMIQMQILQPEMRRLQQKHKDDRQKLNEELMAFYKANNLNPLGGCLPLLLQAPIFFILFNVIRGLTTRAGAGGTEFYGEQIAEGGFTPKYLEPGTALFDSLVGNSQMLSFGVDLAESAQRVLTDGTFLEALPHVIFVIIVAVTSYYQQKQIQGRNPNAEVPPQQKMLMRIFPAMFVVFAFISPGGLVIYFITSNLYRIGLQHYITRSLYHGEDSPGARAAAAAQEAKKLGGGPNLLGGKSKGGSDDKRKPTAAPSEPAKPAAGGAGTGNGRDPASPPKPTSRTGAQNRAKKKKRRR
jgi:YidC/Oxa1 family membrane protein insertase